MLTLWQFVSLFCCIAEAIQCWWSRCFSSGESYSTLISLMMMMMVVVVSCLAWWCMSGFTLKEGKKNYRTQRVYYMF